METQTKSKPTDREISITRILNAPRELVWEVWTDPKHIVEWWGPTGFSDTIKVMDVRPGGKWLHTMHGPDGTDYPNDATFTEVVKPERISYSHPAPRFDATVTFEKLGDKTKLTMTMVFASVEEYNFVVKEHGAIEGQVQTINRLEEHLAKMTVTKELTINRTFNAPRELVFKALAEAEHLANWWGPQGSAIVVNNLDVKPGGMFLYSMKQPNGQEMWSKFIYREITPPEKLVFVSSFSDKDGGTTGNPWMPVWPQEILNTFTLIEHEGKTTLTIKAKPINATPEEIKNFEGFRDSMQGGFAGTFNQLEIYLEKIINK